LAEASQVRRGDRTNWALINGYSIEPGEAFFESIGRPGLFSWQNGRTERVLRGLRVRLVDFSFLVKHTSAGRGSCMEPRLVTVAVGDLAREVPAVRVAPRTLLPTIAGSIPHPLGRPPGCPFHPRCPDAIPGICAERVPALRPVGPGQRASCFLYHRDEADEP